MTKALRAMVVGKKTRAKLVTDFTRPEGELAPKDGQGSGSQDTPALSGAALVAAEVSRAAAYARSQRTASTTKSYAHDWTQFERWCRARAIDPESADDGAVAVYLAWMADEGHAPASIERAWHGVYHHLGTVKGDLCRRVLRGIRRNTTHLSGRKRPLVAGELAALLPHMGLGFIGMRNRAMLLCGFAGGFRRSELTKLTRADLEFSPEGVRVTVRRSKTDQQAQGQQKGIARAHGAVCAVSALEAWISHLDACGIAPEAPLFPAMNRWGAIFDRPLTPVCVLLALKTALRRAGFELGPYGAHSLRAGFVTQATLNRKPLDAIMRQTGHKSVEQLLEYIRHAQVFTENASDGLFDA